MTQREFNRIVRSFDESEPMRAALYYRALALIRAGFIAEAYLLILATWNFARFRYVMRSFDLLAFEDTLDRLAGVLRKLRPYGLMDIDLFKYRDTIVSAFDELASIRGIEYTGATKVLHLLNRRIFVMWDRTIAGWST